MLLKPRKRTFDKTPIESTELEMCSRPHLRYTLLSIDALYHGLEPKYQCQEKQNKSFSASIGSKHSRSARPSLESLLISIIKLCKLDRLDITKMILTESTESQCLQKMTEVEDWSEGLSTIRLRKGYPNLQTIPFFYHC